MIMVIELKFQRSVEVKCRGQDTMKYTIALNVQFMTIYCMYTETSGLVQSG